jgi:hypothetical protein
MIKLIGKSKYVSKFARNNTCHASRQISAPGQVFAFYGVIILCHHNLITL